NLRQQRSIDAFQQASPTQGLSGEFETRLMSRQLARDSLAKLCLYRPYAGRFRTESFPVCGVLLHYARPPTGQRPFCMVQTLITGTRDMNLSTQTDFEDEDVRVFSDWGLYLSPRSK